MKRCQNGTTGVDEILEVLDLAEQLQRAIARIEFVMTEQEQLGLYSLIRNLELESWDQDHHHGYEPAASEGQIKSQRLRDILKAIK